MTSGVVIIRGIGNMRRAVWCLATVCLTLGVLEGVSGQAVTSAGSEGSTDSEAEELRPAPLLKANESCAAGCLQCSNDTCFECGAKYVRSGYSCIKIGKEGCLDDKCQDCSEPCQDCSEKSICYSCFDGYSVISQVGSCEWVGPGGCEDKKCKSCPETQDACDICVDGYQVRSGICQKAGGKTGCVEQDCLECNADGVECKRCKTGSPLRQGTCTNFGCLDDHCDECSPSGGTCRRCQDGYQINNRGRCIECPENCMKCARAIEFGIPPKCSRCKEGYHISQMGTCISCAKQRQNCATCKLNGVNGVACIKCKVGYYKEEGNCIECPENCYSCKSPWFCDRPLEGFKLEGNGIVVPDETKSAVSPRAAFSSLHIVGFVLLALYMGI